MSSSLQIQHDDNFIRGTYRIPTADGDLLLVSQIPLAPIRRMVLREFNMRNGGSTGVGAVNLDMRMVVKTGERIAREIAMKKAARAINQVVNTPAGQSVIGWADHHVPGLGISVDAARKGFELLTAARRGDTAAQEKLCELYDIAEDGVKAAIVACAAFRKMNAVLAQNGAQGEAEISGWLWNVPYRSVMSTKLAISPWDVFRKIFNQGH